MGNLLKAYEAFGKNPALIKKLLNTPYVNNDIPDFVDLCVNGKWDAEQIILAVTMSEDGLDDDGYFKAMAEKVKSTFSGAKFSRNFTILSHPDIGRVLATHEKVKDIIPLCRPEGPITLEVGISWEFRSKKPDEKVSKVASDADLTQKVVDAADFRGIIDAVADEVASAYEKKGADGLQKVVEKVLAAKVDESIAAAQAEFNRVLGLTKKQVVWQDTKTIISAIWKATNAAVTAGAVAATAVAGGPMGIAAAIAFYTVNGLGAVKGFADAFSELKDSFGNIAKNLNSCQADMGALQAQWASWGNTKEAGKALVEQFFPAGLVKTCGNTINKLDGAVKACDRMELKVRDMEPKLKEALDQLGSANYEADKLRDLIAASPDSAIKSDLAGLISNLDTLRSTFDSVFNTMGEINHEVLAYRGKITHYKAAVEAFQAKESSFVKAWKTAVECGAGSVGGWAAGNMLASVPDGSAWTSVNNVCGNIGNYQLYVDTADSLKDRIKDSVESGTLLP